jgi:hypothetical protein
MDRVMYGVTAHWAVKPPQTGRDQLLDSYPIRLPPRYPTKNFFLKVTKSD